MTPERLAEIEERAKAATLGPWVFVDVPGDGAFSGCVVATDEDFVTVIAEHPELDDRCEDFLFIAEARADIPDLLAYIRQLKAENTTLAERNAELERRFQTMALDARRRG